MDRRLRRLQRHFYTDTSWDNYTGYLQVLVRSHDPRRLLEAIHIATPSRFLKNGYLLIRLGKKHIALSPDFEIFELDPRITQAMAGFAFEHTNSWDVDHPLYQTIGEDYPISGVDIPELHGTVLWFYNTLDEVEISEPWRVLLDPPTRQKLVDALVNIAHLHLRPNIEPKHYLMLEAKSDTKLINQISFKDINEITPTEIAQCLITGADYRLKQSLEQLSKDYIEYIRGTTARIALAESSKTGKDVYLIQDEETRSWEPIPQIFSPLTHTRATALLPIHNVFMRLIEGQAYFDFHREIDYDYLAVTCNDYCAEIVVQGIGPSSRVGNNYPHSVYLPNQPSWRQIRDYRFYDDENIFFMSFSSLPQSWPIKVALQELAAICERSLSNTELARDAYSQLREELEKHLPSIVQQKGYEDEIAEVYLQVGVSRDYETERYPNSPACFPCYMIYAETSLGILHSDSEKIDEKLRQQGLSAGVWDPTVWAMNVVNNVDLSDPDLWLDW